MKKEITATPAENTITKFAFKVKGAVVETAPVRIDHELSLGKGTHVDFFKEELKALLKEAGFDVALNMEITYNNGLLRFLNGYAYDMNAVIVSINSKHTDYELEVITSYVNKLLSSGTFYRSGYRASNGFDGHFTYFSHIHDVKRRVQDFMIRSEKSSFGLVTRLAAKIVNERRAGAGAGADDFRVVSTLWPIYRAYVVNRSK